MRMATKKFSLQNGVCDMQDISISLKVQKKEEAVLKVVTISFFNDRDGRIKGIVLEFLCRLMLRRDS